MPPELNDPWLTSRMRGAAQIARAEQAIHAGTIAAMTGYLDAVRAGVLEGRAVTAAAGGSGGEPDLNGWPEPSVWQRLVERHILPPIVAAWGERFSRLARGAAVSDIRYREQYMETVRDRLSPRRWPRGVFETVRYELAEAIAQGESFAAMRQRLGDLLHINAASRRYRARAAELRQIRDDPDTPSADRRQARAELRQVYEGLDDADRQWQPDAMRIARTESVGAHNGGAYAGAQAWSQESGVEQYKQWLATHVRGPGGAPGGFDDRVRPTHRHADGQLVPMDEPFSVGGFSLDYPGDPSGPAAEVIQCRCALLVWEPDDPEIQHLIASGGAMADDIDTEQLPSRWSGPLAPLDTPSGDRRILAAPPDGLRVREMPLPLLYKPVTGPGHDDAYEVGRITEAWVEDGQLMGAGEFDLADETAVKAVRRIVDGYSRWVSVRVDDETMTLRYENADGKEVSAEEARELAEQAWDMGEEPDITVYFVTADWRLMNAVLVGEPAFDTAKIYPVWDEDGQDQDDEDGDGEGRSAEHSAQDAAEVSEYALAVAATELVADEGALSEDYQVGESAAVFTVVGDTDLPFAPRGTKWDGSGAKKRILAWADGDVSKMRKAFLYRDPDKDPATRAAYKFPFADVRDGRLEAVFAGVQSCAAFLESGDISEKDRDAIRKKLTTLYNRAARDFDDDGIKPPWKKKAGKESSSHSAALEAEAPAPGSSSESKVPAQRRKEVPRPVVASAVTDLVTLTDPATDEAWRPPHGWFTDPKLPGFTRVVIEESGRLYGHIADWEAEHISFPGQGVTPPRSQTGYAYFLRRAIETDSGEHVRVGQLTFAAGHADTLWSAFESVDHYDNTCAQGAVVACGEDEHGIWVAGSVLPHLQVPERNSLGLTDWSGDWRVIGGSLEMVGAHAVNTPGFLELTHELERERLGLTAAGPTATYRVTAPVVRTGNGGRPWALIAAGMRPRRPQKGLNQREMVREITSGVLGELRASGVIPSTPAGRQDGAEEPSRRAGGAAGAASGVTIHTPEQTGGGYDSTAGRALAARARMAQARMHSAGRLR
ncbi:phage minor head protein [Streptomyces sp. TR02-1]|uniref:phage minor head protein n=1 Tax=Streptomyces sp. TR02-1 TaxID=3385977 RepID=UPI0039A0CECD